VFYSRLVHELEDAIYQVELDRRKRSPECLLYFDILGVASAGGEARSPLIAIMIPGGRAGTVGPSAKRRLRRGSVCACPLLTGAVLARL